MKNLLKLMQERQSIRMPFDTTRPVTKQDMQQILEAARWSPTAHNMQNFEIVVVDDEKLINDIGNIKRPISETFIRENYHQLSFSEAELISKKTGLLGTMFPPSWRNPDFKFDKDDEKAETNAQRPFPSCPVMFIVVYDPDKRAPDSEGDFLGHLSLGCLMENMWLTANALGISFHIISSLNTGSAAQELKNILGIPENLNIAFSCRLGYPFAKPAKYLRVRREVDDFTSYNKFYRNNE